MTFEEWFVANRTIWSWRLSEMGGELADQARKVVRRAAMNAWHDGRREGYKAGARDEHEFSEEKARTAEPPRPAGVFAPGKRCWPDGRDSLGRQNRHTPYGCELLKKHGWFEHTNDVGDTRWARAWVEGDRTPYAKGG